MPAKSATIAPHPQTRCVVPQDEIQDAQPDRLPNLQNRYPPRRSFRLCSRQLPNQPHSEFLLLGKRCAPPHLLQLLNQPGFLNPDSPATLHCSKLRTNPQRLTFAHSKHFLHGQLVKNCKSILSQHHKYFANLLILFCLRHHCRCSVNEAYDGTITQQLPCHSMSISLVRVDVSGKVNNVRQFIHTHSLLPRRSIPSFPTSIHPRRGVLSCHYPQSKHPLCLC